MRSRPCAPCTARAARPPLFSHQTRGLPPIQTKETGAGAAQRRGEQHGRPRRGACFACCGRGRGGSDQATANEAAAGAGRQRTRRQRRGGCGGTAAARRQRTAVTWGAFHCQPRTRTPRLFAAACCCHITRAALLACPPSRNARSLHQPEQKRRGLAAQRRGGQRAGGRHTARTRPPAAGRGRHLAALPRPRRARQGTWPWRCVLWQQHSPRVALLSPVGGLPPCRRRVAPAGHVEAASVAGFGALSPLVPSQGAGGGLSGVAEQTGGANSWPAAAQLRAPGAPPVLMRLLVAVGLGVTPARPGVWWP
jgi:hypothetical protein